MLSTIDMATVHRHFTDASSDNGTQLLNPPLIHASVFADAKYVVSVTAAGTIVLQRWRATDSCCIRRAHRGMATVLRSVNNTRGKCVSAGLDGVVCVWTVIDSSSEIECQLRISHGGKPNDVVVVNGDEEEAGGKVVVADTTNNVTIYSVQ